MSGILQIWDGIFCSGHFSCFIGRTITRDTVIRLNNFRVDLNDQSAKTKSLHPGWYSLHIHKLSLSILATLVGLLLPLARKNNRCVETREVMRWCICAWRDGAFARHKMMHLRVTRWYICAWRDSAVTFDKMVHLRVTKWCILAWRDGAFACDRMVHFGVSRWCVCAWHCFSDSVSFVYILFVYILHVKRRWETHVRTTSIYQAAESVDSQGW